MRFDGIDARQATADVPLTTAAMMLGHADVATTAIYSASKVCFNWWARQDSNLRPTDYESAALTN